MAHLYLPDLTTLTFCRTITGIATANTDDDAMIRHYITQASTWFQTWTGRTFVPYVATLRYDAWGIHLPSGYTLDTGEDLLALTALTNGDGTALTSYVLEYANTYPKWRVRLKQSAGITWTYDDEWEQAITLTGVWGYHNNYATAWANVDTLGAAITTTTATAMTLTTGTNVDDGSYIQIDDEVIFVTGTATSRTIVRGQLGTTAATHLNGATVKAYVYVPDVQWVVTEIVKFMYDTRDTIFGRIQAADGLRTLEAYLPPYIIDRAKQYRREEISA